MDLEGEEWVEALIRTHISYEAKMLDLKALLSYP